MDAHTGQCRAWDAHTRKLVILAGWQSGKTDFAVQYALRQIARRGPCDAVVAAPSYPLLTAALQPRLIRAIKHLGTFADPVSAARAYDAHARKVYGEFAKTNASLGLL